MTVDDVTTELGRIAAVAGDDESAHGKEDALWESVLQAIADGAPNAVELAQAALRTRNIVFNRWCA